MKRSVTFKITESDKEAIADIEIHNMQEVKKILKKVEKGSKFFGYEYTVLKILEVIQSIKDEGDSDGDKGAESISENGCSNA